MSPSFIRRARFRARTIIVAVALVGLVPGVTPGLPEVARAAGSVCGRQWGPAVQVANLPGNLLEVSGFVSSARYPGVAWMIRDSDNPESLYSFQLEGDQPRWQEFKVSGTTNNVDWEDIAYTVGADGRGRVWILENGIETGPKKIYEVLEPNPFTDQTAQVAATYRVEYPGANRNTESMFAVGGRLAVVTKSDPNRLYTLPSTLSPSGTNRLSDAGRLDVDSWVTAVQVSGDEQLLMAVSTQDEVTVIENSRPGDITAFSSDRVFVMSMPETQREAGDFFPHDACDIVLVSEDATVWRISSESAFGAMVQPGAPSGVTAIAGDASATVSWSPPADGDGAAITSYRVAAYQGTTEAVSMTTPDASTTTAVLSGLTNGQAYTFTVTAGNASGWGVESAASAAVTPTAPAPLPEHPPVRQPAGVPRGGYWMVASDGAVYAFGDAADHGRATPGLGAASAVDIEATPTSGGYWVLDSAGRVHASGDATHFGNVDPAALGTGETITSLSRTPAGTGYWIFTNRGRVLPFGDARSLGDLVGLRLTGPVLDSVATPSGRGYYMVASDGGVFAFGDARFHGSMGGTRLNAPVQSLVPDPDGAGYWLVASDGGVFAFDAPFRGSMGATRLNRPVAGMVAFGNGYLMLGEDGGAFNFSDRPFHGSLGDRPPAAPMVSVAVSLIPIPASPNG